MKLSILYRMSRHGVGLLDGSRAISGLDFFGNWEPAECIEQIRP